MYNILTDIPSAFKSEVLVNVSIENSTESELKVTCEFRADVTGQRECVVIWHRRTDVELKSVGISFLTIIPISQPGEYSVAVFGKHKDVIETGPFFTRSVLVKMSSTGN